MPGNTASSLPEVAHAPLNSTAKSLPPGKCSFDLPIAGILIRILDLPTSWEPFVADRYGLFAQEVGGGVAPDLQVRCLEGRVAGLPIPSHGEPPVVHVAAEGGGRFTLRSHWQDGWFDPERGLGEIIFTSRDMVQVSMSLENYLRVACQVLLTRRQAFLLHAAGVVDGTRCFLMFGASGAGKSTATKLSIPRPALSDDLVAVDVASAIPRAHAVPFYGAFPPKDRARGSFRVAAALRLRRSQESRVEPLGGARAIATLSASVPFLAELGLDPSSLTEVLDRFRHRVPVAELYFAQDSAFWAVLHKEFGKE